MVGSETILLNIDRVIKAGVGVGMKVKIIRLELVVRTFPSFQRDILGER